MAPLSLYDITIPSMIRHLKSASKLLEKAGAHVEGKDTPLIEGRLIADMLPLPFQIQVMTDSAKNLAVRVGKAEAVVWEDNEKTIPELQARLNKGIAFLEKLDPHCMDGMEDKEVSFLYRGEERKYTGANYVLTAIIPNFYFHYTTLYAILRKEGVPLGKKDYLF
ncbi:hypothetical protein G7Y89_g8564 [Cudoniella acicularis]|uniref:DUF1993 domain-containing protein n=1 Tax=Cudoniella acicularis TaxID=354080 RepID=A0A8H4RGE0_9HELO|nr:hypothetical protein G7Y89_g8564 [Cudoniella acicularis]